MPSDFSISELPDLGSVCVRKVTGRLEADTAQELRKHCADLRETGHNYLALDLSEIQFIASSGVGSLLALTEEFSRVGGGCYMTSLSAATTSVIRLLNLERFLAIYPTAEEAAAIFR